MIELSDKYKKIGEKVLKLKEFADIRNSAVKIAYLASDKEKKQNRKIIYADCRKTNDLYSWCCPYDFLITIYEPNVVAFTEHQLEILLRHELHHIGIDNEGTEPSFYIVPHDIEEFWEIIKDEGLEWDKVIENAKRR